MSNPFTHLPTPMHCPPMDPTYPFNEGAEIARVARLLGGYLQPWQRMVINRATQYRPVENAQGQLVRGYKYSKVLISVPRQSGKTHLILPKELHSLMLRPSSRALYTAQTGADARIQMLAMMKRIAQSDLADLTTPRRSNGSEGISLNENGSELARFSPTFSAVHGEHPHLVVLDEIWKHSKDLGEALLGAIVPSQITIKEESQIWMISTKGTAKSEFMNGIIDDGLAGTDPSLLYVEFSMPEDMDPYDPATWWKFHPALGNTITEDALYSSMGLPYGEWMRAYMNVVVSSDNPLIPIEDFDHLEAEPLAVPDLNSCVFAYEAGALGECGCVVVAWIDLDGTPCVRVLRQAPGTAWLPPYVAALSRRYPGASFVADDGGPTRAITDALNARDDFQPYNLEMLSINERTVADSNFLRMVLETKNLKHDGSQPLRDAIGNVSTREYNGTLRFDRDRSPAPIAALIASSVALYAAQHPTAMPSVAA